MKSRKIHAAANLLQKTDQMILDISNQFGYENGRKFAGTFKTVMGTPPAKYRKGCYRAEGTTNKKNEN
jgi:methylphosphotriester-DNA--protein-cysteine methyltransferase